ncbi:hypothetical protein NPIL_380281 [Nephila pilipes]|uniref:Uncharacterized protein n=1 Tax=Nephila pilipes TaxID=299642 RepID=A0A8X6QK79_NEPPI|nr:hypothetical protein NPIL_380281 [Nephila pilipes]
MCLNRKNRTYNEPEMTAVKRSQICCRYRAETRLWIQHKPAGHKRRGVRLNTHANLKADKKNGSDYLKTPDFYVRWDLEAIRQALTLHGGRQ